MVLLAVNKPRGVVCTTDTRWGDQTIYELLNYPKRIFSIGRLDQDSEGLLLMTNNGDILNKIMRAGNYHEKEYVVTVDKEVTPEFLKKMSEGIYLEELDVPSRDIFADHDGYDTYETMYRAGHVYGVSHAIVATQHYHNVRAVYIGHQLGITTYGVDAAETDSSGSWMTLREYGSRMKAFFQAGIFKPEAKVLGEQIDLFSDGTVTHDQ